MSDHTFIVSLPEKQEVTSLSSSQTKWLKLVERSVIPYLTGFCPPAVGAEETKTRNVSKTEMRLVKISLSHVGGVAVLRFLFTCDRRRTNAGLDLHNSEETDCSGPTLRSQSSVWPEQTATRNAPEHSCQAKSSTTTCVCILYAIT